MVRSSSLRAAICWSLVGFLLRAAGVEERPADASCAGVISGILGCFDLFFARVFMKRVAESAMAINKRLLGGHRNPWTVFMSSRRNGTWSISARVVASAEMQIARVGLDG